ncbi:DNA cytosine methyltransferase [Loktanella sp. R86503]|uniref:DNA cytosine methyltransferase n=1 Tax=Loktanella sp. R86503 TaxID=3093847 RepID=UPI0036DBF9E2
MTPPTPRYAEFFAGAGMVRAALSDGWDLAFANDIDTGKCAAYAENWGADGLVCGDIAALDPALVQQPIDLYWASSPCQDLSLAGHRSGLAGARSSTFFAWIDHVRAARAGGFAPGILAFENVTGLLSSHAGRDFQAVVDAFAACGYRCGALEIDARHFLPQSRPRVFVIALRDDLDLPAGLAQDAPGGTFHTSRIRAAHAALPRKLARRWIWWTLPDPARPNAALADLIDTSSTDTMTPASLSRLLGLMAPAHRARVQDAVDAGGLHVGTIYKRGRPDGLGQTVQRAEVRFDGIAGCLRTPGGGSSRQTVLIVRDGTVTARLLSTREAARLMGLPDSYRLPARFNDAYRLSGDGVAVPVVRHLDTHIFQPLLRHTRGIRSAA